MFGDTDDTELERIKKDSEELCAFYRPPKNPSSSVSIRPVRVPKSFTLNAELGIARLRWGD
jgi:hypothetical protein